MVRYKKDIEKGEKMKNEKYKKKFNNVTTTIKLLFYFLYMEKDIFCSRT